MELRNYLLYTNHYYLSKYEIELLSGFIVHKINAQLIIAALPSSVNNESFSFTSFHFPEKLDPESNQVVEKWKQWDQSFLPHYSSN